MPELPEVETDRRLAQRCLKGRRIARVYCANDNIVFSGVTPRKFAADLRGRAVVSVERKGKYLWLELDERPFPLIHLGMTGRVYAYTDPKQRPRFCKLEIQTDDGRFFAVRNVRRFGRIKLLGDPENEPPVSKLGFDVLTDKFDAAKIAEIFAKRKVAVKAVLLDQRVFAGVGNWIADEVLYQSAIDPRRSAHKLSADQVTKLCRCLKRIVKKATEVSADYRRFPKSWLFHNRWGKNHDARTHDGQKIRFCQVGGRTTAYVPNKQK